MIKDLLKPKPKRRTRRCMVWSVSHEFAKQGVLGKHMMIALFEALPDDCCIVDSEYSFYKSALRFKLHSEQFPVTRLGNAYPDINIVFCDNKGVITAEWVRDE